MARTITSAEAFTIARLTCASSRPSVDRPASGCSAQTPSTTASARTERMKSIAPAPSVTCASLSSRPPIITTSAVGWSASAAAIGGELVRIVRGRLGRQPAGELEVGRRAVEQDDPARRRARGRRRRRARPWRPRRSRGGARSSRAAARAAARRRGRAGRGPARRARAGRGGRCPPTRPARRRGAPRRPSRRGRARRGSPGAVRRRGAVRVPARSCMLLHGSGPHAYTCTEPQADVGARVARRSPDL